MKDQGCDDTCPRAMEAAQPSRALPYDLETISSQFHQNHFRDMRTLLGRDPLVIQLQAAIAFGVFDEGLMDRADDDVFGRFCRQLGTAASRPRGWLCRARGSAPRTVSLVRSSMVVSPLGARSTADYFSELLTDVNMVLRFVPSPFTATMMAIEMPAAINPYSMAVAPEVSERNSIIIRFNFASLRLTAVNLADRIQIPVMI